MRIAVVSAKGQLGAAVVQAAGEQHEVVTFERSTLDVTDAAAVEQAIARVKPEVVINCSGYNMVDAAESHPVEALQVNAFAVRALARAARQAGAVLVHYSTDFVFDPAEDPGLLVETSPVAPRSVYAQSKLLGELLAKRTPRHWVFRVASLYGGHRTKSSLDRIATMLLEGGTVKAFANRTVTSSYVPDLADALARALALDIAPGVYHCVNTGKATWLDVARTLATALGRDADQAVTPSVFDPAAFPARRPTYAALSNAALAAQGVTLPVWQDAIARYARARQP